MCVCVCVCVCKRSGLAHPLASSSLGVGGIYVKTYAYPYIHVYLYIDFSVTGSWEYGMFASALRRAMGDDSDDDEVVADMDR